MSWIYNGVKMSRKNDLERHIRESYELIRDYEDTIRLSKDPRERKYAQRVIEEQRLLVATHLQEYGLLCRNLSLVPAQDILEVANTFQSHIEQMTALYQAEKVNEERERDVETDQSGTAKYIVHVYGSTNVVIGDSAQVQQDMDSDSANRSK